MVLNDKRGGRGRELIAKLSVTTEMFSVVKAQAVAMDLARRAPAGAR
jgi:hypothetical protein